MSAMNSSPVPARPNRRRSLLAVAVLSAGLATGALAPGAAYAAPATTQAAPGTSAPARSAAAVATAAPRAGRLAIGDSVMLGAAPSLRRAGFKVDAAVSRQFSTAAGILRHYGAAAPRNVVLALGTNGTITASACKGFVAAAGANRRVFLVTNKVPRKWEASNNTALRRCDAAFPGNRVVVVDWHALAVRNPAWFYGDGYHLKPAGQSGYTRLIDGAVDRLGL